MNPSTDGSDGGAAIYLPRARSFLGPAIAAPSLALSILITIAIMLVEFDRIPAGVCIAATIGAGLTCYLLGFLSNRDQGFLRFGEEGITEIRSGGRSRFEAWASVRTAAPRLMHIPDRANLSACAEMVYDNIRWIDYRLFLLRLTSGGDLIVVRTEQWSSACLAAEQDIELLRNRGWLKM